MSTFRRIKIVNSSTMNLRVAVVFRDCDLISSHQMRSLHTSYSVSSGGASGSKTGGSFGFGPLSASASNESSCSSSSSSSSSYDKKSEDTTAWHWSNFIVPGALIMRGGTSQIFSVLNDKPIHYITITDPVGNQLMCEHFPTDALLVNINTHGMPVPEVEEEDRFARLDAKYQGLRTWLMTNRPAIDECLASYYGQSNYTSECVSKWC